MGIAAWIILGLAAGMVARMLTPGRDSYGLVVTTLTGVGGALLGGFSATALFDVGRAQGFFSLSTSITALAGAAVLLLAVHKAGGRKRARNSGRPRRSSECPPWTTTTLNTPLIRPGGQTPAQGEPCGLP